MNVGLISAALLAAVTVATVSPERGASFAGCGGGAGAYAYAGYQAASTAHGVRATITTLSVPDVRAGHVAAWVGVGGRKAAGAARTRLQAGIAAWPGEEPFIYAEIVLDGRPELRTIAADVARPGLPPCPAGDQAEAGLVAGLGRRRSRCGRGSPAGHGRRLEADRHCRVVERRRERVQLLRVSLSPSRSRRCARRLMAHLLGWPALRGPGLPATPARANVGERPRRAVIRVRFAQQLAPRISLGDDLDRRPDADEGAEKHDVIVVQSHAAVRNSLTDQLRRVGSVHADNAAARPIRQLRVAARLERVRTEDRVAVGRNIAWTKNMPSGVSIPGAPIATGPERTTRPRRTKLNRRSLRKSPANDRPASGSGPRRHPAASSVRPTRIATWYQAGLPFPSPRARTASSARGRKSERNWVNVVITRALRVGAARTATCGHAIGPEPTTSTVRGERTASRAPAAGPQVSATSAAPTMIPTIMPAARTDRGHSRREAASTLLRLARRR